jgi:hypothetical protein
VIASLVALARSAKAYFMGGLVTVVDGYLKLRQ